MIYDKYGNITNPTPATESTNIDIEHFKNYAIVSNNVEERPTPKTPLPPTPPPQNNNNDQKQ